MDRSEQALASLLDEDESLQETWNANTINRGFEMSPPGMGGSETLGLTERRLVWLDEELETLELADVVSVDTNAIAQSATSLLFGIASLSIVVGAIASIVLWLFTSFSTVVTLAPVGIGVILLLVAFLRSRVRDSEDVEYQHFLEVKAAETIVQVYATESTVESMHERISDAVE